MDWIEGIVGYGPLADATDTTKVDEKIRFSHHSGQIIAGGTTSNRFQKLINKQCLDKDWN